MFDMIWLEGQNAFTSFNYKFMQLKSFQLSLVSSLLLTSHTNQAKMDRSSPDMNYCSRELRLVARQMKLLRKLGILSDVEVEKLERNIPVNQNLKGYSAVIGCYLLYFNQQP